MPRAEAGSTKYLANKMKAKGLQRLRWYCQACQRQMRDENGFKQHTMSEGHVRAMQLIGEDPKKYIRQYSDQFKRDFLLLLRTAHGEKPVHVNRFYQEYIANKEHIHMNATQWNSLSEFAKFLGREGIVRVTEEEGKGVFIAWIDNSPDALRRQDAIRKKERQDRGDEEREKKAIQEQVERAQQEAKEYGDREDSNRTLERRGGEKITLQFGAKVESQAAANPPEAHFGDKQEASAASPATSVDKLSDAVITSTSSNTAPIKLSLANSAPKPKNVFASAKKKSTGVKEQPKKMSEQQRIMNEEQERKRKAEERGGGSKKIKFSFGT